MIRHKESKRKYSRKDSVNPVQWTAKKISDEKLAEVHHNIRTCVRVHCVALHIHQCSDNANTKTTEFDLKMGLHEYVL